MDAIADIAQQNSGAAGQMQANADSVSGLVESIAAVSEENSAATEQVSAATEEMSAQVEETVAGVQTLANMVTRLDELVAQFHLEDEPADAPPAVLARPLRRRVRASGLTRPGRWSRRAIARSGPSSSAARPTRHSSTRSVAPVPPTAPDVGPRPGPGQRPIDA